MTKTELIETFTAEQLADKYLRLQEEFNRYVEVIKGIVSELPEELKNGTEFHLEISRLQSEVDKYRKAFENAKKERDCQVAEYQKKIEELENHHKFSMMQIDDVLVEFLGVTHEVMDKPSDFEGVLQEVIDKSKTISDFLLAEPIKVAEMLITAKGECEPLHIGNDVFKDTHRIFDVSELRQIAEHLLVYCNHNGEVEE